MHKKIAVSKLYQTISDAFSFLCLKGFDEHSAAISLCYILYGIHKQYPNVAISPDEVIFKNDDDDILSSLYTHIESPNLVDIYRRFSSFPHENFEVLYSEGLPSFSTLFDKERMIFNPFFMPDGIKALVAYYVNHYGCESVYEPTCGNASIVKYLQKDCKYVGQSNDLIDVLIARMYHEAIRGYDADITDGDPLSRWYYDHYSAVIISRFYNSKYKPSFNSQFNFEQKMRVNTIEEGLIYRAIEINDADIVVSLLPLSFLHSSIYESLRRELIERNLLDSIILFPNNTLLFSSVAPVIIVCRQYRGNEPVKLYDATRWYKKARIEESDSEIDFSKFECTYAPLDEIINNHYYLNFVFYTDAYKECKPGQRVVKLGELLTSVSSRREKYFLDSEQIAIPVNSLSRNYIEIWKNKNNPISYDKSFLIKSPIVYTTKVGNTYLLENCMPLERAGFALYSGNKDLVARNAKVMAINEDIVDPEYLVYQLVTNPRIKDLELPLSRCMDLSIVIDCNKEDQKALVTREKQKYAQRMQKEHEADMKRLGVKQNVSDLEHMLGPTQMKINRIVSRLEKITPDAENYKSTVKDLRDNIGYLQRVIHFSYGQIDPKSFNMATGDIVEFLQKYVDAWKNYGGNYFNLSLQDNHDEKILVIYDSTMLTVLFDSILSNAARHGFHKNSQHTEDNRVNISLSLQSVHGEPCVVISVANNGDKFKEGFGISDYITKGRFASDSGRSGLGGYHVYQIVKGHRGYMYIDSNSYWNVIIDIILPLDDKSINILIKYEHECI